MKRSPQHKLQITLDRIVPSVFRRIIPSGRIVSVLALLVLCSLCACADTLIISEDGTWGTGPNCPATYCNAAGDSWHWSFEIAATPVVSSSTLGVDFESSITDFEFSDAGTVIPSLTDSQTAITFFSLAQCGGLSTDDQTAIDECTDNQLYSGAESAPTLVPGTYHPELLPEVGGCGDTPGVICTGVTFGNITVAVVPAQTPEPSTMVIVIVPLLLIALNRILPLVCKQNPAAQWTNRLRNRWHSLSPAQVSNR